MTNAFRYRIQNDHLYEWIWNKVGGGWKLVEPEMPLLPVDIRLDLELAAKNMTMNQLTRTETTEGTVFEFVPY